MIRCRGFSLALAGAAVIVSSAIQSAAARDNLEDLRACMLLKVKDERLDCYDKAARSLAKPTYEGRLDVVTEPFTVDVPTVLRFQSDGVIFVLYLKTAQDEVVQNLHIGGGGEGTYLIDKPGKYFLQINGSEGWRIWLEPQTTPSSPTK